MSWWWQWIDQHNLWPQFASLAEYTRGIDWPGERFTTMTASVEAQVDPSCGPFVARMSPGKGSFQPAPYNQPVTVKLGPDGKPDKPSLLGSYLHGKVNHKDLHNPVTFEVEYERKGEFAVQVAQVSGYGGAGLVILVDGNKELEKDFPSDAKGKGGDARYNGRYPAPVPAGKHVITVENPGHDWLVVGRYEFSGVAAAAPVRALGLRGTRTALVWLWNETHTWDRSLFNAPVVKLTQVRATLTGLSAGRWRARPFDPWSGKWGASEEVEVGADGRLTLSVAELSSDTAWRLEKVK